MRAANKKSPRMIFNRPPNFTHVNYTVMGGEKIDVSRGEVGIIRTLRALRPPSYDPKLLTAKAAKKFRKGREEESSGKNDEGFEIAPLPEPGEVDRVGAGFYSTYVLCPFQRGGACCCMCMPRCG